MERLKNVFIAILEGVLFGCLGGLFVFVSLYLLHYFTFDPPSGGSDIHITPLYKTVVFPTIILFLSISFICGKAVFKLLKKQNLQWFYNVIFFTIATIMIDSYIIYYHINELGFELSFESIDTLFNVRIDAVIILFSIFYSFLYQTIKTRIFSKPEPIC